MYLYGMLLSMFLSFLCKGLYNFNVFIYNAVSPERSRLPLQRFLNAFLRLCSLYLCIEF